MLKTLKPDLLVTDIVMPEMEGIGTILEARRSAPDTKVIAISGGGHYGKSKSFLEWASELGADEVLAKPFRMSSLIMAARVVLDQPPPALPDDFEPDEPRRLAVGR
jgi:DNA-binding response OmpR family regulator